ncbi:D-2-hydroxyacid dehydrogenase [Jatrophihabitans telluris]|uniref:D-2-hydroxyacid dehydrogenase n=1 Tax=Jatrophihabitans telluris TaxID=2038343 RepID=A0ABY4QY37_9ACTN|nr:D-2-hydroxyacid dehydrogenase [Jatrophihabitans telluris]UQX88228.1 D-2-hydroxyacid dehydrogenase [Jatrophihabitans telluris]
MSRAAFTGRARINYLSTLAFDEDFLKRIASCCQDVEVRQWTCDHDSEIPDEVWAQVDVLHTSTVFCHPRQAPRLRWVQLDTSGVDHLQALPIWAHPAGQQISLTTIGGVSPVPLAEYVLWSILGTAHRLPALLQARSGHDWPTPEDRWQRMLPAPVRGATVGVVGYGRIGREIGRLAQAFGMHVLGVSRTAGRRVAGADEFYGAAPLETSPAAVELFAPEQLSEVARRSDYLVVVVPLTAATRDLVSAEVLDVLKDQAVLINVARGGIVDESALRAGLRSGRIRAAVLDVFDDEPLAADNSWWDEPNVFVTPHVSGLAPDYSAQVLDIVCENLRRFDAGRPLLNLVDRVQGY